MKFIKYILPTLLFIHSNLLKAQGNLPYVDDKFIHFGFSLGTNMMHFGIEQTNRDFDGKIYHVSVSHLQPGFSVGVISDMRLSRYFNLRFTPTLYFAERNLHFRANDEDDTIISDVFSIPLAIPLHVKYSAERYGNARPYLLVGGGVYIDFGRNKEKAILLESLDYYIEFGVGCDIYFPFFKLAPEIKFAIGMNNVLTPWEKRDSGFLSEKDKMLNDALSKLTSRILTLTFNFE
ncbi:MAG: PorT family protein [Prevotellaceae bacterium]|jgi:hypothetical protein|nr:PorT family protein [Prevotellaceae bacterium]